MEKLKYVLLGSLLFMTLPQAFAVGDTQSVHTVSAGESPDHFSDCYHCSVLQPW